MKYIYILIPFLIASISYANENDSRLSLAKKLMEIDGAYEHVELIKRRTMQDISAQLTPNKELESYYKELEKQLDASLLSAAFQKALADIYTEDELKYMIKEASIPENKALISKHLKYSESSGAIIREWLKKAQENAVMTTLK